MHPTCNFNELAKEKKKETLDIVSYNRMLPMMSQNKMLRVESNRW